MRRRGGLTLTEVIVAAALGLMALGLAWSYLIPVLRASTRGSLRVEMEQQALVALGKIVGDLQSSNVGGLSVRVTDPVALVIQPLKGVREDGVQVWDQGVVVYYRDSESRALVRFEYPGDGADTLGLGLRNSRPRRLPAAVIRSLVDVEGVRRVQVASGLSAFRLDHTGGADGIGQPFRVTLSFERDGNTGREDSKERYSLTRTVLLRSQR